MFYPICRTTWCFNNLLTSSFPAEIRSDEYKVCACTRNRSRDLHVQTKAILTLIDASILTVPIRCPCKHLKDLIMMLLAVRKWPKYHQRLFLFPIMGSCFIFCFVYCFCFFLCLIFLFFFPPLLLWVCMFCFLIFLIAIVLFFVFLFHNLFLFSP